MENQQPTPEEQKKLIMGQGNDLLVFLNKPGVSPPMTPQTMPEYTAWQRCCNLAMGIMSGELTVVQSEAPQNVLTPEMEAAKAAAVKKAEAAAKRKAAADKRRAAKKRK